MRQYFENSIPMVLLAMFIFSVVFNVFDAFEASHKDAVDGRHYDSVDRRSKKRVVAVRILGASLPLVAYLFIRLAIYMQT